jgi:hypothetical protein
MESQGEAMKRMAWAIAGAAALLLLKIPASQALVGDAPWCAVVEVGNGEVEWDCEYQTIEQCVPNVLAGNRGFCNNNPYYVPRRAVPANAKHYPRHHANRSAHKQPQTP